MAPARPAARPGLAVALALAALLAACSKGDPAAPSAPPAGHARTVRYDGSTTISNKILPVADPKLRGLGVDLQVARSGAGKGLDALFAGQADVAGVSRSLSPEELAQKPYFQIIGYDALGVFVNAQNPVSGLTRAQLKDVFTGKAQGWKALGGKDLPVRACTERLGSKRATLQAVQTLAMDGAPYGNVLELEDPADCLALAAREPGAITAATMTYAIPGLKTLAVDGLAPEATHIRSGRYLLTRPLLLVTRAPPTGAVKAFFDFMLSAEGQGLIAGAGFVPAR